MKKVILSLLGIVTVILTVCMVGCVRQEPDVYGSISGFVKDSGTKDAIADVNVMLQQSGVSQMTGDNGSFAFTELETGTYTVVFTHAGYETYEQNVVVKAGVESSVQVSLKPIVPKLELSTNKIDFGKEINTLSFDISNKEEGELKWSLSYDVNWLKCTPEKGSVTHQQKQTVSLTVDRTKLERGAHVGSIVVKAEGGGSETIYVSVSVVGVNLEVNPAELDFGTLTNSIQLKLMNVSKKGTLKYTAESLNNWLTLERTSGEIMDLEYLNAFVSRDGLSAGNYTSSILFKVDSGTVTVPVKMSVAVNEKPTITLEEATDVKSNSVILHGTVVSPGSANITRYGFCWIEGEGTPTVNNYCTNLGDCTKPMAFESYITNLKSETKYTYRAYAENSVGLTYSERSRSFVTTQQPSTPIVITGDPEEVSASTASITGQIGSLGNVDKILHYGHVWSKFEEPTLETGSKTDFGETSELKTYVSSLKNLEANTVYHYRAYATNSKGTSYGDDASFITEDYTEPIVSTSSVTNVSYNSATCGGNVKSDGGSAIIERGVCYSTSPYPTTDDSKVTKTGTTGTFTCKITELEAGMTYYVRAYATNSKGTSYGEEKNFTTTESSKPIVSTSSVTNVSYNSATCGGNVKSDGGLTIIERGICYSTSPYPTTDDSKVTKTGTTGTFTCKITELEAGMTYYVRAYATNEEGTAYGEERNFTTNNYSAPSVTTSSVSNKNYTSFTCGGNVTDDGGLEVTERGICYSTYQLPTIDDNKVVSGSGTGKYSSNVTGLNEGTKYYIRAYAINAKGISYGDEVSTTTLSSEGEVPVNKTNLTGTWMHINDYSIVVYWVLKSGGTAYYIQDYTTSYKTYDKYVGTWTFGGSSFTFNQTKYYSYEEGSLTESGSLVDVETVDIISFKSNSFTDGHGMTWTKATLPDYIK